MRSFSLIFLSFVIFPKSETEIILRFKRATAVSSNAETNGEADKVDTDASAHHFKNSEGVVGMNVSSQGNSTGSNSASIDNTAGGSVGNANVDTSGNVKSTGDHAESYSDIFAAIEGEKMTLNNYQQGKASGIGSTNTNLKGGGNVTDSNGNSKSIIQVANAAGTGSLGSQSEILSNQVMTWDSLMAQLVGSAVADGTGHAQANMDLSSGTNENNMEISGLVSGTNSDNGNVNAQVNGNGNIVNDTRTVLANMYGFVDGKQNSTLVGASSISANSSSNTDVKAFGNGNANSNGTSSIDLKSETGIQEENGLGHVILNGSANGADSHLKASNGLKVKDENGETVALGSGSVNSMGNNANSSGSQYIDTSYDENGETKIISKGEGLAMADNGNDSQLQILVAGNIANNQNGTQHGIASGTGLATGQSSNITGNSFTNIDDSTSSGNSMMNAFAGGVGSSSANTNATLVLKDGSSPVVKTVHGSVSADGDKTQVQSVSVLTEYAGVETLSNYQKASSSSSGSSKASASSSGMLKRRKRSIHSTNLHSNFSVMRDRLRHNSTVH